MALIAACVVIWLIQLLGGGTVDRNLTWGFGMIPTTLLGDPLLTAEIHNVFRANEILVLPPWLTLVTSMFLHGGNTKISFARNTL